MMAQRGQTPCIDAINAVAPVVGKVRQTNRVEPFGSERSESIARQNSGSVRLETALPNFCGIKAS